MRQYWQLLALVALALSGAIAWQMLSLDPGYVLVTFRGWSVETTLLVGLLLVGAAAALLWLLWRLLRAPFRLWRRHRRAIARERLADGLLAVCDGQWARADKLLVKAAGDSQQRPAALLLAAQVAIGRGDNARADQLLDRARAAGAESGVLVLAARRLLDSGRPGSANELLEVAARESSLSPAALELQAHSLLACGRGADALALLPALRSSKLREGEALLTLENQVASGAISQARAAGELSELWSSLPRTLRQQAPVVLAFARRARALQCDAQAAEVIESLLGKHWDDQVAAEYGLLSHAVPRKALKRGEQWLQEHPGNVGALLCLGELCRREQLWGKAESFLQQAVDGGAVVWEALGRLYSDRGDHGRARQALHNALFAQRGEPTAPVRAVIVSEREAASLEQRTSMGLPQLPSEKPRR